MSLELRDVYFDEQDEEMDGALGKEVAVLLYNPLMEEEDHSISKEMQWSKSTLVFAKDHKSKVMRVIRSYSKNKAPLTAMDYDDIYMEVIEYLYKSEDYSVEKAIEATDGMGVPTLENYVNMSIRNCVKRYIAKKARYEMMISNGITSDDEGKDIDTIANLPDTQALLEYENRCTNINTAMEALEHKRYAFGPDIFMVMYIRMITLTLGLQDAKFKEIIESLGIAKKEFSDLESKIKKDVEASDLMASIAKIGPEASAASLATHVFNSKNLFKTVVCLSQDMSEEEKATACRF